MSEKIKVREPSSLLRRLIVALLLVPPLFFGIIAFLGWVLIPFEVALMRGESSRYQLGIVVLAVLILIFGPVTFFVILNNIFRRKIEVIPLLVMKSNVAGYLSYALCDEGIIFYYWLGNKYLYRWSKFISFAADQAAQVFRLRMLPRGTVALLATGKFEEARLILSKNVPSQ